MVVFDVHGPVAEAPALARHAAQGGQVAVGRRRRELVRDQQRAEGAGVLVSQHAPVERQRIGVVAGDHHAGEEIEGAVSACASAVPALRQPNRGMGAPIRSVTA